MNTAAMASPGVACPSCGATLAGDYCSACGQRAPQAGDFSWKSFSSGQLAVLSVLLTRP
jgi:hypothetical protein